MTPERVVRTRRGDVQIENYVAKLMKLHRWA
jgi:hypothetical protein